MSYLEQVTASATKSKRRRLASADLVQAMLNQPEAPAVGASAAAPAAPPGNSAPAGVPSGGGGVDNWINQALGILKLDSSYAPGIKNMIMKESGGKPTAVNNWDSNAKKGTPSKGLMQTIDPTFKAWALPGYNKDVFDPVSNIIAGIRYAQNRYGDGMLKSGGRKNKAGKYIGY